MRVSEHLEQLADASRWTFEANPHESVAEAAAWAAIALAMHDHPAAKRPARWLAQQQQPNGSVGASATQDTPRWPTSLAMLAWKLVDLKSRSSEFRSQIQPAVKWTLNDYGRTGPQSAQAGHDTTLVGWSWAADTHSWMEPTCFFVKALTLLGYADHPRVQDGVRMIVDRFLPSGGCNYGNTFVLGQQLLPHRQPSGIAMWAIADHGITNPRIALTLKYLESGVSDDLTTSASLAFALLGLTAFARRPQNASQLAFDHLSQLRLKQSAGTYHLSLLLLAALDNPISFEQLSRTKSTQFQEVNQ